MIPASLILNLIAIGLILLQFDRSLALPPTQGGNLLENPGFEQPFGEGVAGGWQSWYTLTEKQDEQCLVAYHYQPKWNVETTASLIRDGASSQYIGNNWDTWAGGVYQTIPDTPGTTYRFSFDGRGRGTSEPSPAPSESGLQMNLRAGIDPNGSGLWNDVDVVWGTAGSPHDTWQRFTVEATATGNQITVFTGANWGVTGVNQCRQFLDTWYDAAELVALAQPTSPPPTQSPSQPAATFAPAPTGGVPTEQAAATLIATLASPTSTAAGTSSICINTFLDENNNGLMDPDEGFVAGVTLTVAQGSTVHGQGVSTGTDRALCFGELPVGTYQVGQTLPPSLETTTQANATIDLGEGQTVALAFGSRMRTTPTADPEDAAVTAEATTTSDSGQTGSGGPARWPVFVGIGAVVVGVILLGALIYVLLRR